MAFDIASVTNQTIHADLGFHRTLFNLQDALFPGPLVVSTDSSYNSSSYLFADACNLGDGSQNCTASCSSNDTMFANLQNLHNCMAYQNVAELYQKNHLTGEAQALVEALNIEPASPNSTLVFSITQNIQTCLIDYCTSIPGCIDGYPIVDPTTGQNHSSPFQPGNDFDLYTDGRYLVDSICGSLHFQINPDIGGIGVGIPDAVKDLTNIGQVYISYWIQAGLAFLGFLAAMLYDSWIYYGCVIVLALPHGFRKAREKAQMIQLRNKEHLCRLVAALTDFQKAQSIFMSSINIAALVVTHRGDLDPEGLLQLSLTYTFTELVALGGLVPVTFTLFTLYLVDMCSWYLIFLSSVSIALSTATLVTIGHFDPNEHTLRDLSSYASSEGPPSCNYWRPGAYCYSPTATPSIFKDEAWSTLGFCLFILVLVMIKQTRILTSRPAQHCLSWTSKRLVPCRPVLTVPARCIHRAIYLIRRRLSHRASLVGPFNPDADYPRIIGRIFVAVFHVLLTGLYVIWFFGFGFYLSLFAAIQWLDTSWSFGQVLAIMVWAQPLCEYVQLEFSKYLLPSCILPIIDCGINLSIGGMKRGMDHKIMPPYRMIRDDENLKVVGGDSEIDTQPGGYSLKQRKSPLVGVTPADGNPFDQKTGYNTIDITEIIPVHRRSIWDVRRDNTDYTRLMG